MILTPTFALNSVLDINMAFLKSNRILGLILDLDNTLSLHGSPLEEEGVLEWLNYMRSLKIKMIVVSNNTGKRVTPLAKKLNLEFIAFGLKPLTFGISKAVKKMGLPKKYVCVVGDQIFTDVIAGNISGVRSILVNPFELETKGFLKMKRRIEQHFCKRKFESIK